MGAMCRTYFKRGSVIGARFRSCGLRTFLHESDARSKLVWSKSDRDRPAAIDAVSPKSNALASCDHRASSSGQLTPLVGCLNAADIDMSSLSNCVIVGPQSILLPQDPVS